MINTERKTPQSFFDTLNSEFNFTLDVAASIENAKCERYFSSSDNALLPDLTWAGEIF